MNATEPSVGFKAVARFIPTIETPTSAILPIHVASLCFLLAFSTLTYKNRSFALLRVLLLFPIVYCGYDVAYGAHAVPNRPGSMGLTLVGACR